MFNSCWHSSKKDIPGQRKQSFKYPSQDRAKPHTKNSSRTCSDHQKDYIGMILSEKTSKTDVRKPQIYAW